MYECFDMWFVNKNIYKKTILDLVDWLMFRFIFNTFKSWFSSANNKKSNIFWISYEPPEIILSGGGGGGA